MHSPHSLIMKDVLLRFIMNKSFPCVMAKAVATKGMLVTHEVDQLDTEDSIDNLLKEFYRFIDAYRENPERLSSFIILLKKTPSFEDFENIFWKFLKTLNALDKKIYEHDPRVSSTDSDDNFSFSLKAEAFFILALHPDSPRFARRFSTPAIVFNPHQQFENLRKAGTFQRIRNIIRKRDLLLQGSENPMLKDFGNKSEIYQYTGRVYQDHEMLSLTT